jgi:tetratricopeptide (TPR) repeat protein
MEFPMIRILALGAVAAMALVVPHDAHGAVTVIGNGGMAEQCSVAAIAGKADARFEQYCTDAIDYEMLSPRDRAGTFVNRGVLKLRRASWDSARQDFDQAVRLYPKLGEAYVNRGAASLGQRRYADSLPDLDKGIALGIEEPAKAYFNRALAHEGMDDMKSAYFDYQKAIELSPDWSAPKEQLTRFKVSHR